jgi:hypothetical protein
MKRIFFLVLAFLSGYLVSAQTGYQIKLTLKPYKNEYVYLGYYYGKLKALADSAMLDSKSSAVFSGKQKLPGGIYFIVSPRKELLFELLLDKEQNFSIAADTAGLPKSVLFTGSEDNTLFQSYTRYMSVSGREMNQLQAELQPGKAKADSAATKEKLQALTRQVQQYRSEIEKKYPSSLLTALFRLMKEPVVPEKQLADKRDTLFAYNYFKSHYWDGVSFKDERILRTPIFETKLEKYYRDLVVPDPDSINKEIDQMLEQAKPSKEVFKYLLTNFVQKYINPVYMGQDAVFVHLYEKYINNNKEIDWFTEKYNKYMFERAYSLMANLIGQPASNLDMTDTTGKARPLYDVQAPFTVICFWDPTCSHCKDLVPRVDSIFQAKWKKQGVQVYGVMVDGGKEAWMRYIRENKLKDWIHVYETQEQKDAVSAAGKAGYKQLYDVYQTPILYLLDKDKRIIAKKLTYLQIDDVITMKMKSTAAN